MEDVIFRGSSLEVRVRLHGNLISAIRSINDPQIESGERVDVFIHRLFVIQEGKISLVHNQTLTPESVVI